MIDQTLAFCFKGDRNYVHGTDIFNKVIELIFKDINYENLRNIDMSIRSIMNHNLTAIDICTNENKMISPPCNVSFKALLDNKQIILNLIENKQNIDCRYEYEEDKIIEASNYDEGKKEIDLTTNNTYTLIENIVALNKGLLNRIFPKLNGKWYFTRIKFKEFNPIGRNDCNIKIAFKKSLQLKLTDSLIYLDNNFAGNIYFSLV